MITAALEIDAKPVGSGVFVVLPRIGEVIFVRIYAEKVIRVIRGRVGNVFHVSTVRIGGGSLNPEATVTLTLVDATVKTREGTNDD